ncbi:diguanylate cyclase (GGDEF) domain-containing protein [Butyrivibrio hungatei DSM 14810]|uniref:Diguanylate cyclase (GGDEF) domain-containing protein n=1 Tax=Butyrivibrio hungatei DSM 14810 TaxID=1121132 RepID=A0A1M7S5M1_9FIRM|nr:GGDEF domain-containing protein [Butyrivibrio hungatei]SHN53756.1 diguanylate cyclase (GGDEF) domain-containing protein [Butyrivibrio hungatei DSM 14810]
MNLILIAANVVSSLFLLIIVCSFYQLKNIVFQKTRYFRYCLWVTIIGLLSEALSYVFDGQPGKGYIAGIFCFLGYAMLPLLVVIYGFYVLSISEESFKSNAQRFQRINVPLNILELLFIIAGTVTGNLYSVVNDTIIIGPWSYYVSVLPAISFICLLPIAKHIYNFWGVKEWWTILLIISIPIASIVFFYVTHASLRQGFIGAALALAIIYVIIQTKIITEADIDATLYNELSINDALTGLRNRRGYMEIVNNLPKEETVGVVFCDANSLKAVNDTYGHEAGDRLIKKLANILKEEFPDGNVCRISGDEFVCILNDVVDNAFADRMVALASILRDNDRIASYGFSVGKGEKILEIVNKAEHMMYNDKERYYKETGKDRRR